MPYIIGNETFERLATFGMLANFTVYLVTQLRMKQVKAVNLANVWFGTTNFAPLLGAFLSDAYLGRFLTLAIASVCSLLGLVGMFLTAAIPALQPPDCKAAPGAPAICDHGPSMAMLALLFASLGLLTVGAGGIRPCSLPFGVDQFDATTEKGRQGINSFFNWYYFTFTVAIMVALTAIVYVQNSVSWSLGLGILAALMLVAVVLFFLGTRVYVYAPPEGSVFSGIAQVFVAAYRKRKLQLPPPSQEEKAAGHEELYLYDPLPNRITTVAKLHLTQQFRFLNKAAAVEHGGELLPDGGGPVNPWRLCSVQQVEEVKCLIRIVPIWASGIICFVSMAQQGTVSVLQALKMNRHLGPRFQVPPGSLGIISMLVLTAFIPLYDRLLVPAAAKATGREGGITLLQRMGTGMVVSVLSMVVAALVERRRRAVAVKAEAPSGVAPMTVMWLAPQLGLMGLAEALNGIAQIEFYYKQFPEHMRSVAGSLFFCRIAGANYLSSAIVALVRRYTGGPGRHSWLDDDINLGRVDYFYFLISAMGVVNLAYFLVCAHLYRYKGTGDQGETDREAGDTGDATAR